MGWRYGVICYVPSRGQREGWVQIEVPVRLYASEGGVYVAKPNVKAWCHRSAVNPPGDFIFHGKGVLEAFKERKAEKKAQQAKAEKRKMISSPSR